MEELIKYLELLNSAVANKKIYDIENPDYYISGFEYDSETNKVYVNFKEDK